MKLVQILGRELGEWPVSADAATQDNSSVVHFSSGPLPVYGAYHDGEWSFLASGANSSGSPIHVPFASDYSTAIVTRADWEAERARIAKPAKKAGADGWIRHRGGKCPVDEEVVVDVRFRSGAIETNNGWPRWKHNGDGRDIMAYRIHKPAEQPEPVTLPECYGEVITPTIESTSGPLEWRDRIHEIDAEVTQRNEAHRKAIKVLEEERASFVQRLEDEGFRLIRLINDKLDGAQERIDQEPAEDMINCASWKKGDTVECLNDHTNQFTCGALYMLIADVEHGYVKVCEDDEGYENGWGAHNFKFHSRPSA